MSAKQKPERDRIAISLSPELRQKIGVVADMMGLTESAAARHLMLRGLEGMMHLLSSTSTSETLRSMYQAMEREIEKEDKPDKVVRVPSNTRTKGQNYPPSSPGEVFDFAQEKRKKEK